MFGKFFYKGVASLHEALRTVVIPMKMGIQYFRHGGSACGMIIFWIPAFAGMTESE